MLRRAAALSALALLALCALSARASFVVIGAQRFRTLGDVVPSDTALGCESTAAQVPVGWSVASAGDAASVAALSYPWGAVCLVLADGSSLGTRTGAACGTDQLVTEGDGTVRVAGCSRRILLTQAADPSDVDTTIATISNTVVFNRNVYAALSNNVPDQWAYTCQSALKRLPSGWTVASPSADVSGVLLGNKYTFGTVCMVLADGSSVYSTSGGDCGGDQLVSYNSQYFGVRWCYRQVLITRPATASEPDTWDAAPFITNYAPYNGYAYATLDNAVPASTTVGCQSAVAKLSAGWSIAANDADARAVIEGAMFGTNCLVLADGTSYNHAGQLCSGGVNQLVSDATSTYYSVNWCDQRVLIRHALPAPAPTIVSHELPMRVLLMSVSGDNTVEGRVGAARAALQSHGIPFDEYVSRPNGQAARSVDADAAFRSADARGRALSQLGACEASSRFDMVHERLRQLLSPQAAAAAAADADAESSSSSSSSPSSSSSAARSAGFVAAPRDPASVRAAAARAADSQYVPLGVREELRSLLAAFEARQTSRADARALPTSYATGALSSVLYTSAGAPKYYAIVSTVPQLPWQDPADGMWKSSLTETDRQALEDYARTYHVRKVELFAFPQYAAGLEPTDYNTPGSGAARTLKLSAAAASFAGNIKTTARVALTGVWNYPTRVRDASLATPIMQFVDANGVAVSVAAATIKFGDAREELHMMFDHAEWSLPSSVFAPVWVQWVTRGVFVGARRVLLSTQIDDLFLASPFWDPATNTQKQSPSYRLGATDLHKHVAYMDTLNAALPAGSTFRIEHALNGNGILLYGGYDSDALYLQSLTDRPYFFWESHTYTHASLDAPCDYEEAFSELKSNQDTRDVMFGGAGYSTWSDQSMVTPMITGLFNGDALRAMVARGITNVVGDNSRPELVPANKYHGIHTSVAVHGYEGVYIVPRSPTEIYFDCSNAAQQEAEYNYRYQAYWGRAFTVADINAYEAGRVSKLLLAFRHDPYMFHQGNLRQITGQTDKMFGSAAPSHSLLSLWISAVAQEYLKYASYPVLTYKHDDIAKMWLAREARDACGIDARLVVDSTGAATGVRVKTTSACEVALTGATFSGSPASVRTETYGADTTAWVSANANSDSTFTLATPLAL